MSILGRGKGQGNDGPVVYTNQSNHWLSQRCNLGLRSNGINRPPRITSKAEANISFDAVLSLTRKPTGFFFASSLPLAWPFYTLTMAHGSTAAWEAHVQDKLHGDGAQHAEDDGFKNDLLLRP